MRGHFGSFVRLIALVAIEAGIAASHLDPSHVACRHKVL